MKQSHKKASRFIGRSRFIEGNGIHNPGYSSEKTAFYKELFEIGMMKDLMPLSEDKKGYAVIIPTEDGIQYFAGVLSDENPGQYETVEIDSEKYLVTYSEGGLSRLLFDELENNFFSDGTLLNQYNGKPVLEVLLNGNPSEAEVELWVPINH